MAPFFDLKCRFEKKGQMMEKKEKRKNKILFFRLSLFAGADFWKRGVRAKQDLDTAVITHSFSSLRIGTSLSKRRVFKGTKSPFLGPTPSTDEKRQLKDDKPGIPMIGSKLSLTFHSGYRRPQNCFSVCTSGKIQNTFVVL